MKQFFLNSASFPSEASCYIFGVSSCCGKLSESALTTWGKAKIKVTELEGLWYIKVYNGVNWKFCTHGKHLHASCWLDIYVSSWNKLERFKLSKIKNQHFIKKPAIMILTLNHRQKECEPARVCAEMSKLHLINIYFQTFNKVVWELIFFNYPQVNHYSEVGHKKTVYDPIMSTKKKHVKLQKIWL